MIKDLIEVFVKHLKMSEDEAIVAALAATAGFVLDYHFFPAGLPPGTVTVLSGGSALLATKWFKNRSWYQSWVIRRIDSLVKQGHLKPEEAAQMKKILIEQWFDTTQRHK